MQGVRKRLTSVHNLMSKYNHLKSEVEIMYICRSLKCENVLVVGDDKYPKVHKSFGHKHFKNKSNDCIIIEMPIEKQLQYFLEHHVLSSDRNNQQEDGDTLDLC